MNRLQMLYWRGLTRIAWRGMPQIFHSRAENVDNRDYDEAWQKTDSVQRSFLHADKVGKWVCIGTVIAAAAWLTVRSLWM